MHRERGDDGEHAHEVESSRVVDLPGKQADDRRDLGWRSGIPRHDLREMELWRGGDRVVLEVPEQLRPRPIELGERSGYRFGRRPGELKVAARCLCFGHEQYLRTWAEVPRIGRAGEEDEESLSQPLIEQSLRHLAQRISVDLLKVVDEDDRPVMSWRPERLEERLLAELGVAEVVEVRTVTELEKL